MVELDVGILRCIFQNEPDHSGEPNLRIVITGNRNIQMLACVGCPATYLVKSGLPMMVEDSQLATEDRRMLRRLRRQHKPI